MQAMSPGMHIQPITRSQDESSELCEVHCLAGFLCFWCLRLFGLMRRTCETTGGARLFSEGSRHTSDSVVWFFFWIFLIFFSFICHWWFACRYWITENPQVLDCRGRAIAIVDTWPKGLFQFGKTSLCLCTCMHARVSVCNVHALFCASCVGILSMGMWGHGCVRVGGCVAASIGARFRDVSRAFVTLCHHRLQMFAGCFMWRYCRLTDNTVRCTFSCHEWRALRWENRYAYVSVQHPPCFGYRFFLGQTLPQETQ